MAVKSLDHYTIRTTDLERSARFYRDILGLTPGPRPNFAFPGYWLYVGGRPVVHLAARSDSFAGYMDDAGAKADASPGSESATGNLDHVAFVAERLPEFRTKLQGLGVDFVERKIPDQQVIQLFLRDPDGIRVELNFPL